MTRNNNKINLPTNTTDIKMLAKYLKYIDSRGRVTKDVEQDVFAEVKIKESRKNVTNPKKDTHTKSTLKIFGLIDVADDESFSVSSLGKEVLNYYQNKSSYNEEERIALMLKVLCRWEINDNYGRHIHPGFILMKLLCDPDLNYYITNHELSHFTMSPNFKFDEQYDEIKQCILKFRSQIFAYDEDWLKSKSDIFLSTFDTNWGLLTRTSRTVTLSDKDYKKLLNQWKKTTTPDSEDDDYNDADDDEQEESQDNDTPTDEKTFIVNECRLNGLAAYVARLYLSLLEGVKVRDYLSYFTSSRKNNGTMNTIQKIYYGAPGTGKSNEIKRLTGDGTFCKNYTFRTTFHPDFDYSTFVGAYKPIWDKEKEKIVYEFRPQTFLKAYVAAWTHPSENVALVIEEINRGNCAQIFGDIFQLLDRENDGLSKYPIESDIDMKGFLSSALSNQIKEPWAGTIPEDDKENINEYYSKHYDDAFAKINSGEILTLPKNLSILATMNTSDQSLFPMDSAFKRRWEWQYMPIVSANKDWKIQLHKDYENIDWWEFLERINNVISDLTTSEDKQLGYFFCQPDDFVSPDHASDAEKDLISAKHFVDKVIFYLWNDVFKDYAFDAKCCKDKDGKEVLFAKFYNEDGKSVNFETLNHFFESLTVDNKPSLVKEIVPTSDASGEEDANVTDATSVNEEPSSTGNESVEAESSTTATTDE